MQVDLYNGCKTVVGCYVHDGLKQHKISIV